MNKDIICSLSDFLSAPHARNTILPNREILNSRSSWLLLAFFLPKRLPRESVVLTRDGRIQSEKRKQTLKRQQVPCDELEFGCPNGRIGRDLLMQPFTLCKGNTLGNCQGKKDTRNATAAVRLSPSRCPKYSSRDKLLTRNAECATPDETQCTRKH